MDLDDRSRFERLVEMIRPGTTLARTWRLEGGVSAQVTAVEIVHPEGETERLVVRRHGENDRNGNHYIATDEFRLLRLLEQAGFSIPKPVFVDQSGEIFSVPCIVLDYIDGTTETGSTTVQDLTGQMAACLADLHRIGPASHDLSFLPALTDRLERMQRRAADSDAMSPAEARIHQELASPRPRVHTNGQALLHGDFWPGNILWRDHQIAAVIDWEDATVGDPLFDVASARLELFWMFGEDAMIAFTTEYASRTAVDLEDLPYWEICAALDPMQNLSEWGYDPVTEATMRRKLDAFVERALGGLASVE